MIRLNWTYESKYGLTKWYGHVRYYDNQVIGQWFALNAVNGSVVWERQFHRANTVRFVTDDVIIASEMRSDGPWTCDFGIYAINRSSGNLMWVNHGKGIWGSLWKACDLIPGFTNDFRDSPKAISGSYLLTSNGRVLDIGTGSCLTKTSIEFNDEPKTLAQSFYFDNEIKIKNGILKSIRDGSQLTIEFTSDSKKWEFAPHKMGLFCETNYYAYRLMDEQVVVILADGPAYVPIDPQKPNFVKPNRINYQIAIIDINSGAVDVSDLPINGPSESCTIQDVRGHKILLAVGGRNLYEIEIMA